MTPAPLAHLPASGGAPAGAHPAAMDVPGDSTGLAQSGGALFGDLLAGDLTGGQTDDATRVPQNRTKKELAGSGRDTGEDVISLIPTTTAPIPPAAVLAQALPVSLAPSTDRKSDDIRVPDAPALLSAGSAATIRDGVSGDGTQTPKLSRFASPGSDLMAGRDTDPVDPRRIDRDTAPSPVASSVEDAHTKPSPIATPSISWTIERGEAGQQTDGVPASRPHADPSRAAIASGSPDGSVPDIIKLLEHLEAQPDSANRAHETGQTDRGTVTPAAGNRDAGGESPALLQLQAFLTRPHADPLHAIATPGWQNETPPDIANLLSRLDAAHRAAGSSVSTQARATAQDPRDDAQTAVHRQDGGDTVQTPSLRDLAAMMGQFQTHHEAHIPGPVKWDDRDPSWRQALEMLDKLDKKGAAAPPGETRQPVETGDGIPANDPRFPLLMGAETRADGRQTGDSSGERAARHDGEPSPVHTDAMAQNRRDVTAGRFLPGAVPPASQPPLMPPGIPDLHNSTASAHQLQNSSTVEHQDHSPAHHIAASSVAGNRQDDVMAGVFPGALLADRTRPVVPAVGHHAAHDALPPATAGAAPPAHAPVRSEQLHTHDTEPTVIPNGIVAPQTAHAAESAAAPRTDTPSPLVHVTEEIIVRQAILQTAGAASSFRAVLHPEDLGIVMVHVRREHTGLHVTLIPQQTEAQAVIDTHLSDLVDTLQRSHESAVHVHIQAPDQHTVLFDGATPAGLQANLGSGANGGYSNNAGSGQHFDDREPSGWSPQESPNIAGLASTSVRSSRRPATDGIMRGRTARIDIQA